MCHPEILEVGLYLQYLTDIFAIRFFLVQKSLFEWFLHFVDLKSARQSRTRAELGEDGKELGKAFLKLNALFILIINHSRLTIDKNY